MSDVNLNRLGVGSPQFLSRIKLWKLLFEKTLVFMNMMSYQAKDEIKFHKDNSDRIFIEVLRKKCHYILDLKLNSTAEIIKRMIEGISRFPPENQQIHYEGRYL
ncbi:UNVERIFIED_CONTAM: hypothetical protein NCL1_30145 [Trichonephila clavipes]